MEYRMTKFIRKSFERYCERFLPGETKQLFGKI